MKYVDFINSMKRFGSTERDICIHVIGAEPELIRENVVIAPWWEPPSLPTLGKAAYLSESELASTKVWDVQNGDIKITYIKTGIGAPMVSILSVSDNTVANKSLVSGRTQSEMDYRHFVRRGMFPQIILSMFK